MTNRVLISLDQIQVQYRNPNGELFFALKDINLEVRAGEYLAILGASGSGKTSLSNIIGLLSQQFSGKYQLADRSVPDLGAGDRVRLRSEQFGFIFQDYVLLDHLSAVENVELALRYSSLSKKEIRKRAEAKLALVGLEGKSKHRPYQLSGGQKQRVAVARALIKDPAILIADEPTGALDSASRLEILSLLQDLNDQGVTIITVTHSEEDARAAKRIIHVQAGKIISDTHQLRRIRYFGRNVDLTDVTQVNARRGSVLEHLGLRYGIRTPEAFLAIDLSRLDLVEQLLVLDQVSPEWLSIPEVARVFETAAATMSEVVGLTVARKTLQAEEKGIVTNRLSSFTRELFSRPLQEETAMVFLQNLLAFPTARLSGVLQLEHFFAHTSRRVRATAIYLVEADGLLTQSQKSEWVKTSLKDEDPRVRSNTLDHLVQSGGADLAVLRPYRLENDAAPRVRAAWAEVLISAGARAEANAVIDTMIRSPDRAEMLSAVWILGKDSDFNVAEFIEKASYLNSALVTDIDDVLKTYARAKKDILEWRKLRVVPSAEKKAA